MIVEFLARFSKDLDVIQDSNIKQKLIEVIEEIESIDKLSNLKNIKKLKGFKSAFRLKLGDYRIGFFFENQKIIFARIVHRKEIYKIFP
jgi:mRNA interferase RelE/StbE